MKPDMLAAAAAQAAHYATNVTAQPHINGEGQHNGQHNGQLNDNGQ